MPTYFVTGGTGFVGSRLLRELCRNDNRVRCLTRHPDPARSAEPSVEWIEGDLTDTGKYLRFLRDTDYVLHLAGTLTARREKDFYDTNVRGTEALLNACRQVSAPLKRIVHMSSIAAMGPNYQGRLLRETDACHPQSIYGMSKYQGELVVRNAAASLPVVILRPSFVYGGGDMRTAGYLRSFLAGVPAFPMHLIKTVSVCHVSDVVRSCLLTMSAEVDSGEVFIVSDPEPYGWERILGILDKALEEIAGVARPEPLSNLRGLQHFETLEGLHAPPRRQQSWGCDTGNAECRLGFRPAVTLHDGIREAVLWCCREGYFDGPGNPTPRTIVQGDML